MSWVYPISSHMGLDQCRCSLGSILPGSAKDCRVYIRSCVFASSD